MADYLRTIGASCPDTFALEEVVKNHLLTSTASNTDTTASLQPAKPYFYQAVLSWGSNQYGKIRCTLYIYLCLLHVNLTFLPLMYRKPIQNFSSASSFPPRGQYSHSQDSHSPLANTEKHHFLIVISLFFFSLVQKVK